MQTQIYVKCGNEDCGIEFKANTDDPVWICPNCGREIENRYYPFLTAKLMQAKIDGQNADWRERYKSLIEEARLRILERYELIVKKKGQGYYVPDLRFLDEAEEVLKKDEGGDWREKHDELLKKARKVVLEEDKILNE